MVVVKGRCAKKNLVKRKENILTLMAGMAACEKRTPPLQR
jgi:hypothetical protein